MIGLCHKPQFKRGFGASCRQVHPYQGNSRLRRQFEKFFMTISYRMHYYIENEEYLIDSSHSLDIAEHKRRAKIKRVIETAYESPFLKRKIDKKIMPLIVHFQ